MSNTEIEIQVKIEKPESLLEFLESNAEFQSEKRQLDEYFNPPDRDFAKERPMKEWLRLRDAKGNYSLNYKNWHYDADGRSDYCDEYETEISDIEQFKNVFQVLGFKALVTVDKIRKSWNYQDYEISMDSVKGLGLPAEAPAQAGDFVEIEYKGTDNPDPKKTTNEMIEFLKFHKVGKIERNYLGYPFQLLFPKEIEWEEV